MRVILTEDEILTAIEDYVLSAVNVPDDIRIDIDLKATRGDLGYTAEIDLLAMDAPVGDRSVDPRIEPTEEAREEGLGIVKAIEEARASANAPRRRGRPPGSKNKPKDNNAQSVQTASIPAPTAEEVAQRAIEANTNAQPETEAEVSSTPATDAEAVQAESAQLAEPSGEAAADAGGEVVTDTATEAEVETEVAAEADASLDTTVQEAAEEVSEQIADAEVPAADVPAADVTEQAPEALADNASDAGDPEPAAVVPAEEAAEDEVEDITPTPETPGTETAEVAPPAPTRSLFGNLTKPTN